MDNFKKGTKNSLVPSVKYYSQLTIFYEDGLYGFLQYSHKPIAIEFKKWVRRDVLPELRKRGTYSTNNDLNTYHLNLKSDTRDFKNIIKK